MDTQTVNSQYEQARKLLLNENNQPTDCYRAYLNYQQAYRDKKELYLQAQAQATSDPKKLQNWPIAGVHYMQDVDQAMNNWLALGYKQQVEAAIDLLKAAGSSEAASILQAVKNSDLS